MLPDEAPEDIEFLEDEGLPPETPAFSGLFRPALFKTLLHKARQTTSLGSSDVLPGPSSTASGPHNALFASSKQDKD